MKIGIVTFYGAANYGAMLQAYALWKFLESRGHEVVFIRTPCVAPGRISLWRCFVSRSWKGVVTKLKMRIQHSITEFAASYPQTITCSSIEAIRRETEDCDAYIVGSDQMWNPIWCSGEHLPLVMLDFAAEGKPRISYAASFGVTSWDEKYGPERAGAALSKFKAISVREASGVEIVKNLTGRMDAKCLLDPTLLHGRDFYQRIIAERPILNRGNLPYVFRYWLQWSDVRDSDGAVELIKNLIGVNCVEDDSIPAGGFASPFYRLCGVRGKIVVPEWLNKIAGASFVLTNSFHGTVFAILFHRPFLSVLLRGGMRGMNERALSLLQILGLEDRAIYSNEVSKYGRLIAEPIDWMSVESRLNGKRDEVKGWLEEVGL